MGNIDYTSIGVTSNASDTITMTLQPSSPRGYLLDPTGENYQLFKLQNAEFTYDVDTSKVPCGVNGALYFVSMEADGSMRASNSTNTAGARYGTGYCDAQCRKTPTFINGKANFNSSIGACCQEMDIWEGNSISTAYTPHTCTGPNTLFECTEAACNVTAGNSCDSPGCDFNPYRLGDRAFYGPGKQVDTTKKFTVVTQFLNDPSSGVLQEIRRLYVQNGKVVSNAAVSIPGLPSVDSLSQDFCAAKTEVLAEKDRFTQHGGMAKMGKALSQGMVLAMSIWDDKGGNMLWLDSTTPPNSTALGASRGSCPSEPYPAVLDAAHKEASVVFGNIKWGDLNSTFSV